ncbi:helix-loop-helix protein delilah-like [Coccinella septempunctata]|uniref:helix-loop-helix protein delilah-like n=1 Tax=Coccinella septempunctata TaxID=41139 RepID=UPI001D06EDC5|nr:helix-loop-helix protein delilah-like [Coccinella septempunctata]
MDSLLQEYSDMSQNSSGEYSKECYTDSNNNESGNFPGETSKADKYSLRPRTSRRCPEVREDFEGSKKSKKSVKQKSAPLSKYRRKTANARERNRMREINQAFETLRSIIPHGQVQETSAANEKLTKITTLRLAMRYISALSSALNCGDKDVNLDFDFESYNDLDFLLESDGESLSLSEHSLVTSPDFQDSTLCSFDLGGSFPSLLHSEFADHSLVPPSLQDFFFT